MKIEFFDEDDYLVNIMFGKVVKKLDGKMFFFIMEVILVEEEGYKMIIEYIDLVFDKFIKESFFFI